MDVSDVVSVVERVEVEVEVSDEDTVVVGVNDMLDV